LVGCLSYNEYQSLAAMMRKKKAHEVCVILWVGWVSCNEYRSLAAMMRKKKHTKCVFHLL